MKRVGVANSVPGWRAERLRVSGEALRTEALALVRERPGAWTLRTLALHLGRRYRVRPEFVREQLELSPDLRRRPLQMPEVPARRTATAATPAPPARSWDGVVDVVTLWLSEADTDAVLIDVASSSTARLALRYDFVRTGFGLQIWLSAFAPGPELLKAYLPAGPWSLTPPNRLPLVSAPADLAAPAVVVWRHGTAIDAAVMLRALLGEALGVAVGRLRIERQQCTPAELERRLRDETTIRRLGGRLGARRPAVSQCDRCGQPLSDPTSVQLGIGPECRKYYSKQVLTRLRKPGVATRPGSIKEKEWLVLMEPWLGAGASF